MIFEADRWGFRIESDLLFRQVTELESSTLHSACSKRILLLIDLGCFIKRIGGQLD